MQRYQMRVLQVGLLDEQRQLTASLRRRELAAQSAWKAFVGASNSATFLSAVGSSGTVHGDPTELDMELDSDDD